MSPRRGALALAALILILGTGGCYSHRLVSVSPVPLRLAEHTGFTVHQPARGLDAPRNCIIYAAEVGVREIRGDTLFLETVRVTSPSKDGSPCLDGGPALLVRSAENQVRVAAYGIAPVRTLLFAVVVVPSLLLSFWFVSCFVGSC